METFPELLGELCRNRSAVLVQFHFLLNIRQAVLTYCSVIKVLKAHHSQGFAQVHPGWGQHGAYLRAGQLEKYL